MAAALCAQTRLLNVLDVQDTSSLGPLSSERNQSAFRRVQSARVSCSSLDNKAPAHIYKAPSPQYTHTIPPPRPNRHAPPHEWILPYPGLLAPRRGRPVEAQEGHHRPHVPGNPKGFAGLSQQPTDGVPVWGEPSALAAELD